MNHSLQLPPEGWGGVLDTNMEVRRLTPLEAERLQGMPDGWTDIGDWVDSKGKKHKGDADAPRYKALGNSIALPFWKWLCKRISAQYERDATMGSLFDGIGGFDICWAMVNGEENVRWSSEIEEFPIAVVKKHFGDEDAGIEGDFSEAIKKLNRRRVTDDGSRETDYTLQIRCGKAGGAREH